MENKHLPMVEAIIAGDHRRVRDIVERTSPDDPLYVHYVAIHAGIESVRGRLPFAKALEKIRESLQSPPEEVELFAILLGGAAGVARNIGEWAEVDRFMVLLKGLVGKITCPELLARLLHVESSLQYDKENITGPGGSLDLMDRALGQDIPAGEPTWYGLKAVRAHQNLSARRYASCQRDLDDLESYPELENVSPAPLAYLRAALCLEIGRAEEGLAWLAKIPKTAEINPRWLYNIRFKMLLIAGRCDEAENVLQEAHRAGGVMPPPLLEYFHASLCLARGNLTEARAYMQRALAGADRFDATIGHWARDRLIQIELADRHTAEAERLLRQAESNKQTDSDYMVEWIRLHLQRGREDKAVETYRQALAAQGPELIEHSLRWAHELSVAQWARLQKLARKDSSLPLRDVVEAEGAPRSAPAKPCAEVELVGASVAMDGVRSQIERFAPLDAAVLTSGETGTGKEVVARLLHRAGPRAAEPFLPVNCAALSDTLIASELFGHVKGAFTGAVRNREGLFIAATKGTIFLDEIHAMSPRLQATLLRVLETGEVRPVGSDCIQHTTTRVIAATNQSLEQCVERGEFRNDLFFRLARLHIELPPLRERRADIPLLAKHFLRRMGGAEDCTLRVDLIRRMCAYDWPGNVRELRNEVERMVLVSGGAQELTADLFRTGRGDSPPVSEPFDSETREPVPQASSPPLAEVPAAARPPGPAIPVSLRNANARRRFLLELFETYDRLTQIEIVRTTGCSPNTIRRDLRELCLEGRIRRVDRGGNRRLSYYESTR